MRAELVHYNAARQALASAVKIDEIKDIRDKSLAMELYAYQRRDRELIALSAELRRRAGRRLGQIMAELRAEKKLAKAGRRKSGSQETQLDTPTLAEQGIDKNLANEARKLAAMPEDKFEADVAKAVAIAVAAVDGSKEVIAAARAESQRQKQERRAVREQELATRQLAMPDLKFNVIVEDFEWDYVVHSRETGMDRHAANHYPVSESAHTAEEVVERTRERFECAAADCVLFMWATVPYLDVALDVLRLRGLRYVSNYAWGKDRFGTGHWNRNKHEHLLIGVRGNVPAPAPGTQWDSLIMAPVGEHSAKPECFLEMIESYYPTLPKIELNRRGPLRPGWSSWGYEAEEAAE